MNKLLKTFSIFTIIACFSIGCEKEFETGVSTFGATVEVLTTVSVPDHVESSVEEFLKTSYGIEVQKSVFIYPSFTIGTVSQVNRCKDGQYQLGNAEKTGNNYYESDIVNGVNNNMFIDFLIEGIPNEIDWCTWTQAGDHESTKTREEVAAVLEPAIENAGHEMLRSEAELRYLGTNADNEDVLVVLTIDPENDETLFNCRVAPLEVSGLVNLNFQNAVSCFAEVTFHFSTPVMNIASEKNTKKNASFRIITGEKRELQTQFKMEAE